MVEPLSAEGINRIDSSTTPAERFWMRIPVLGWFIAGRLWDNRVRPLRDELVSALRSRPDVFAAGFWGEGEYRDFAASVCRIAAKEMGWPCPNFVPQDPFRIVFWSYEDGLDMAWAIQELEALLGLDLLTDENVERWSRGDLGTFVDELWNKADRRFSLGT